MTQAQRLLMVTGGDEFYGIGLESVQEIRAYRPLTRLPHAPKYVAGILNVSGQILPVIDLGCRLWGHKTKIGPWHVIVLVAQDDVKCGILVDSAHEIVELDPAQINAIADRPQSSCFAGIATLANIDAAGVEIALAILDIDAVASLALNIPEVEDADKEVSHA